MKKNLLTETVTVKVFVACLHAKSQALSLYLEQVPYMHKVQTRRTQFCRGSCGRNDMQEIIKKRDIILE